jgi:hypothetical protein
MQQLLCVAILCSSSLVAQTISSPFASSYSYVDLGTPAGVPASFGGVAFKVADPDGLYLMGGATSNSGAVYRLVLARDANRHITGFVGAATRVAAAPLVDGGAQFETRGVLFYTRFPSNEIGQIKPGSSITDKVVDLSSLGVCASTGSLTFVPPGFPNGGRLKIASFSCSRIYTASVTPDGTGTFDLVLAGAAQGILIQGRPEGLLYVPPDSPQFSNFRSMLVCEYASGEVAAYDVDGNGDPLLATRRPFMTGLSGAEGAAIDPVSGDFVFSTFGSSDRVLSVRGLGLPCSAIAIYGTGTAGSGNVVPVIGSEGCFARSQTATITVQQGRPFAPGVLFAGLQTANVQVLGATLLVVPTIDVQLSLDASGRLALGIPIPDNTRLLNTDFYFQGCFGDAGASQGVSATAGMRLRVR